MTTQQLPTTTPQRNGTGLMPLTQYYVWGGIVALLGGLMHGAAISRQNYGPGYVDRPKAWLEMGAGLFLMVASVVIAVATIAAGVRLASKATN